MKNILALKQYGSILSNSAIGETIYTDIQKLLQKNVTIIIDMSDILSMATFNAKQIFGRLYVEMGSSKFYERVAISNASENIKLIIRMGVENAIEEKNNHVMS